MDNKDRSDLSLYDRLPESVQQSAGFDTDPAAGLSTASGARAFIPQYVESAVAASSGSNSQSNSAESAEKVYSSKIKHKVFLLDTPAGDSSDAKERQRKRKRNNKAKPLTSKEKRALNVYEIPNESRKYDLFMPLHELWKGYMEELFGSTNPLAFTQKLLKADFHGAIITVARSKCPTYIGASGIVAQETENVFKIITPSNKLLVIPKVNNVFTLKVRESVFTVHGNQFRYRAAQRSAKKFKVKPTIDL
ncbi:RNase P/RNase MRP complex subunit [Dissophora globulifera]|nr:RNase P/RNase MRP complex subunit [Dissophora globulifera]